MRESRSKTRVISRSAIVGLAVFAASLSGCGSDSNNVVGQVMVAKEDADFYYYIESGTGERIDAGETVELMEPSVQASLGDTIRIDNDDDRGHTVGPFFVAAGETFTHQFKSAGTFSGECTVSSEGEIEIVVS